MPLNIGGGGGNPFIRFKASINSWEKSNADSGTSEFTWDSPAIFDVEHVQLGWLLLAEGQRDWQAWPNNAQTPQPEGEYKRGFSCQVFSKALFGAEPVREFCTSASGCVEFIKELYNSCEANFGKGQVPVVKITGSRATKIGKGTTRIPTFEVVKWVDRPEDLTNRIDDEPTSVGSRQSVASPSSPTEAAAPVAATADEF